MNGGVLAAVLAAAFLAAPAHADAATQTVSIQFSDFGPSQLDVLPGETVEWTNVSQRRHTVTSDTAVFASGDLLGGDRFSWAFGDIGAYLYHCTVHAGMVGEVDVRRVTLGLLPPAVIPAGTRVELTGRTADPSKPVRIERSGNGTDFTAIATATPAAAGDWSTTISARATGDYRAASGADVSETRRLLVSNRRVKVRATRAGVEVTVTPSDPYARIVLQRSLRERFGWWPTSSKRLDYVSRASFRVPRPARVRAVLVDRDGWTALATSPMLVLRHARRPSNARTHTHRAG
jgi:plastocyanin